MSQEAVSALVRCRVSHKTSAMPMTAAQEVEQQRQPQNKACEPQPAALSEQLCADAHSGTGVCSERNTRSDSLQSSKRIR